jgi:hypothetical protein
MNMKWKRFILGALAALLILGSLTGCAEQAGVDVVATFTRWRLYKENRR